MTGRSWPAAATATATADRLWDPEQGQELRTLTVPDGRSSRWPGGSWAAGRCWPAAATTSTVRLWDPVVERFEDRLPGYRSDDPGDPDRLNRDAEAAALAEMITAQSAPPPLAIGLFGDWGEGKTHFLRRIADHVDALASTARDDPWDRLTYSAVRQVHFNAWHYAETDLWASLVAELFSQMAAAARGPTAAERRTAPVPAGRRGLPPSGSCPSGCEPPRTASRLCARNWRSRPAGSGRCRCGSTRSSRPGWPGLAGDQPEQLYQSMRAAASGIGGTARLAWQFCAVAVRSRWFWLGLLLVAAAIVLAVVARGPLGRLSARWRGWPPCSAPPSRPCAAA